MKHTLIDILLASCIVFVLLVFLAVAGWGVAVGETFTVGFGLWEQPIASKSAILLTMLCAGLVGIGCLWLLMNRPHVAYYSIGLTALIFGAFSLASFFINLPNTRLLSWSLDLTFIPCSIVAAFSMIYGWHRSRHLANKSKVAVPHKR